MSGYGILLVGVLVVVAVLAITSAIVALAPYVAGAIVILGLIWFTLKFGKDDEKPPDDQADPQVAKRSRRL